MGRKSKDETALKAWLIALIIVLALVYDLILKPFIEWSKEHWIISSIIIIVVFGAIIFLAYIWITTRTEETVVSSISNTSSRQESSVSTESNQISHDNQGKEESSEPTIKRKSKMERIIEELDKFESHSNTRNEEELEKELFQYLKGRFKSFNIVPQYKTNKGKIDLVIDEEIAIELKIADSRANVRSLSGQIEDYLEDFTKLIVVILDVDKVPDLDDYVKRFKKKGVKVIVLSGNLKRKKQPFMKQSFYR